MKLFTNIFCALPVIWLSGCATSDVHIKVHPGSEPAVWERYAWLETNQPKTGDLRIDLSGLDTRIRSSIDHALAERGRKKVAQDQADVLLAYRVAIQTKEDMGLASIYNDHAGTAGRFNSRAGGRAYSPVLGEPVYIGKQFIYEEGSLNIDFFDAKIRTILWHGTTRKRLETSPDQEQQRKNIDLAVHKILKHLPKSQPASVP